MGITETLRRIWLFSANKTKSSESFSKQPTQLIIAAHNCHVNSSKFTEIWCNLVLQQPQVHLIFMQNILLHCTVVIRRSKSSHRSRTQFYHAQKTCNNTGLSTHNFCQMSTCFMEKISYVTFSSFCFHGFLSMKRKIHSNLCLFCFILVTLSFRHFGCVIFFTMVSVCKARQARLF